MARAVLCLCGMATKAELERRVAELEAEVADWQLAARRLLARLDRAEDQLAERSQAAARPDAFLAFVASLPRQTVYRALARALHPDVGGETAAMQALNQAYHSS